MPRKAHEFEQPKKPAGPKILRDFIKQGTTYRPSDRLPDLTDDERARLLRIGVIG